MMKYQDILTKIKSHPLVVRFRALPPKKQYTYIGVAIFVVVILLNLIGTQKEQSALTPSLREVTLISVSEIMNQESSLPLVGTITSLSEATIRTETSGKLNRVYKRLGDFVTAGEIIASFENSAERASVLQAEGLYEQAKASRDIARINNTTTSSSLNEAKNSALNALSSAYITMDDSVHVKTDGLFSSPQEETAKLLLLIPDASLTYTLETSRKAIEKMLDAREATNKNLTLQSDLVAELNKAQQELQTIKAYLDNLATAVSKGIPDSTFSQTSIDAQKVSVSLARTAVSGALSSITSTRSLLVGSTNAQEIAGKTATEGTGEVTTADAQVKSVLGAYNGALSRLEKTIVRSPITGTLNSLSIETGDFVSAFTEVAVVSNNKALEVITYVTEDDAKRIRVGSKAIVQKTTPGVVTRIAEALDPKTKKIEVRVGITDRDARLINGQTVSVTINRTSSSNEMSGTILSLPISSLKITPSGTFVFILSASNTLQAIPVTLGALLGDEVQVLSGLSATSSIIFDARGLKDGMSVRVKETKEEPSLLENALPETNY